MSKHRNNSKKKATFAAEFSEYRNRYAGQTIVVCGCGQSLRQLSTPEDFITIGVNDVGRQFDPDYLVVLNPRTQFKKDRFRFVENSRAKAVFTQLNLGISHPNIVRFKLGARGGTDCSSSDSLPYTRNSPYVAMCLAAYMGAKRIGLIGVDFTHHHFYANTGKHSLSRQLVAINNEYRTLVDDLSKRGVEVTNLSADSLLTCIPKQSISDFQRKPRAVHRKFKSKRKTIKETRPMKVVIEKYRGPLINNFLEQMGRTVQDLGHQVEYRQAPPFRVQDGAISIVWNGRHYRKPRNIIYCEHGWLPRDAYQVSPSGINADSHIAPFKWNGEALPDVDREAIKSHIESLKNQAQSMHAQAYTSTSEPVVRDLPSQFLLVPLQIEQDTNIVHHVPRNLRKMQALVDLISQSNPPFPVIYKQHPSDRRHNKHLRLRLRRRGDSLRPHSKGNIHQILKSGRCQGIISLNSNVVHDGFLWDVPSIVLGRNIWPREGTSPFLLSLPSDWREFKNFYSSESTMLCRESYLHHLLSHQWVLDDACSQDKVGELLERKAFDLASSKKLTKLSAARPGSSQRRVKPDPNLSRVNVYAKNCGWLFEDLKQQFSNLSIPGVKVVTSERPIAKADAWISLRASEAIKSPDKSRTLVQIHDLFEDGLYSHRGNRRVLNRCGALCLTNAEQQVILERNGFALHDKEIILRPLGALSTFTPRIELSARFTVGWVGRPVKYQGDDFKRAQWFVEALGMINDKDSISAVLIGERLSKVNKALTELEIDNRYICRKELPHCRYPEEYRKLDCLVITSRFAAGPNCLFEALASGVPVISTRCGWSEKLITQGENGYIVDSPAKIAEAIESIQAKRGEWFEKRHEIVKSGTDSLESWLLENVRVASSLNSRAKVKTA